MIPPVVEWHLQENSMYRLTSGYAWLVYYPLTYSAYIALTIRSFVHVPFNNSWNQHTYTSLILFPFGLWAPVFTDGSSSSHSKGLRSPTPEILLYTNTCKQ